MRRAGGGRGAGALAERPRRAAVHRRDRGGVAGLGDRSGRASAAGERRLVHRGALELRRGGRLLGVRAERRAAAPGIAGGRRADGRDDVPGGQAPVRADGRAGRRRSCWPGTARTCWSAATSPGPTASRRSSRRRRSGCCCALWTHRASPLRLGLAGLAWGLALQTHPSVIAFLIGAAVYALWRDPASAAQAGRLAGGGAAGARVRQRAALQPGQRLRHADPGAAGRIRVRRRGRPGRLGLRRVGARHPDADRPDDGRGGRPADDGRRVPGRSAGAGGAGWAGRCAGLVGQATRAAAALPRGAGRGVDSGAQPALVPDPGLALHHAAGAAGAGDDRRADRGAGEATRVQSER